MATAPMRIGILAKNQCYQVIGFLWYMCPEVSVTFYGRSLSMTPYPPETLDLLALSLIPGLGPRLTEALLARFGSAAAIRRASTRDLQEVTHIGPKLAARFATALAQIDLERELELLEKHQVHLLTRSDSAYPSALKEIGDHPHLLFVRGAIEPNDAKAVGIVGSRQHTEYGRRTTERLSHGLARAGFTIVSGLARGIDGIAHRAALEADGRTIAVLAGGLSRIYPPEHADLAEQIARHGALMTETPMQVAPQPGMFPARNRLISGMCQAVIVVEAHEKSGALITARHALEQNREVFAVPGPVDSIASAGCMKLLRQGAKLIRGVEDVLEDLQGLSGTVSTADKSLFPPPAVAPPDLTGDPKAIWDALHDGPLFIDQLAQRLSLTIPEISKALTTLELKRLVVRKPGNQLERK
jgi:DNA processing protein